MLVRQHSGNTRNILENVKEGNQLVFGDDEEAHASGVLILQLHTEHVSEIAESSSRNTLDEFMLEFY